jgi:Tfp pilus assembly protein PilV
VGNACVETYNGDMRQRLRSESGIGLVDLLIAMAVLQIAVFALVAALSSGHVALLRAGKITTASALASAQLEAYRALRHDDITLSDAATDATYNADTAFAGTRVTVPAASCAVPHCEPTRVATGADGRTYRVDTYIVTEVADATVVRQVKKITVVVRDPNNLGGRPFVRQTTAFDALTEG